MRLIDADYVKSKLNKFALGGHVHYYVCGVIDDAPTIDAKPVKHAYWIKTSSTYHFKCSSCGVIANIKFHRVEDHKFCWHCGAKMDGESE